MILYFFGAFLRGAGGGSGSPNVSARNMAMRAIMLES
jgi:hypothetical protein